MQSQKNNENLVEISSTSAPQQSQEAEVCPQDLPAQFWDEKNKQVKLDELIRAYKDLAARDDNLVETNLRNIPESYEKYQINSPSPLLEVDEDILKKFYDKRFTNEQAQLVYDLAGERVLPVLGEMGVNFEAERQLEKLARHFGGQDKFNEVSRQISSWAKQNVNPEIYDALGSTAEGVIALYNMMSSSEPALSKESGTVDSLSESSLRKMMEDPRYWRDKDSAYISKITKGFEKLYPEK